METSNLNYPLSSMARKRSNILSPFKNQRQVHRNPVQHLCTASHSENQKFKASHRLQKQTIQTKIVPIEKFLQHKLHQPQSQQLIQHFIDQFIQTNQKHTNY